MHNRDLLEDARTLTKITQNRQLLRKFLQDLDTRNSWQPPTRAVIQAPLIRGICKDLQGPLGEDLTTISTRSSNKDLCRIRQGPLREDFASISTTSSRKDVCKIMQEPLQDVNRIFTRSCHKDLYWTVQDHEIDLDKIMQAPVAWFHQDPHKIFSQGPVQDLGQGFHILRTFKTAPWNSCKMDSEKQLKSATAPQQGNPTRRRRREGCKSDPTCTTSWEGCVSRR